MNHNESNSFTYTYSAKEQAELKKIREKYLVDSRQPEDDKMAQIRRLDAGVTKKATVVALEVGILGTLIMGMGMSLVMTDFREILGAYRHMYLTVGILTGVVGMIGVLAAYPLYQHLMAKERRKVAPQILRLTEELMEKNQ